MTRRVALIAAWLSLGVAAWPAAEPQRGPLASQKVTNAPLVAIELPANDHAVFETAMLILRGGNVRFGLEGPALDPAIPLVDFARPPEQVVVLSGLTIREALDKLVAANPRFRWSESDGMIVARIASNGGSLTDRRLPQFVVVNASPRAAMEALVKALAPDRAGFGIMGMGRPAAGREGAPPTREGKDVSLSLDKPTVLAVLNALSRDNGALSWMIRYERAPAGIDTAAITFIESGEMVMANPPGSIDPMRPAPSTMLRVPIFGELLTMINEYRRFDGASISFEQLPQIGGTRSVRGVPPLNLSGLPPAEAIRRIVAHDSRYEMVERPGRFLIRPKSGASSPLDTVLPSFVRVDEPFDAAVGGLLQRLSLESVSMASPQVTTGRGGTQTGAIEAAKQKPVSVSFREPTTVRDVLDALCQALGSVSWTLRAQAMTVGRTYYVLEINSPEGWTLSRSFTPSAAVAPLKRPTPGIPESLDRDISRVNVSPTAGTASPFLALAAAARMPLGLELAPSAAGIVGINDPRLISRVDSAPLGPGRFSDAFYLLLERAPDTGWSVGHGGVLNVAPAATIRRIDHFMNRPIGRFEVSGVPASAAIALLRRRMNPETRVAAASPVEPGAVGTSQAPRSPVERQLARPITLTLENPTPRDVLNAIVAQNGGVHWILSYEASSPGQPPQAREEDSIITLSLLQSAMLDGIRFARDGAMSATAPVSRPSIPSGPRVMLDLPVNERTLSSSLERICRSLSIRCTVEVSTTTPPGFERSTFSLPAASYDFSGMAPRAVMDKLVELAPELSWTLDGEIYRVRSRSLANASSLPLDRRIPSIDQKLETVGAVLEVIRTIFNPPVPGAGRRGGMPPPATTMSLTGPVNQRDRTVAIALKDFTVRQFLDEVARQYGDLSWNVRYLDANGTYPQFELMLNGSNWGSGTTVTIR
jgi:hypothetical protein